MEQAELHSSQLVKVEISIYPFFLNMKTETNSGSHAKTETKKGKPYHKTIAAVFLASLFEVRDNERPNPDNVAHNIHQPRQRKVTCLNRPSQRWSRLHPITLSQVTMNSVTEKGSSVPNTVEAVFCRQRLSNLTSKVV